MEVVKVNCVPKPPFTIKPLVFTNVFEASLSVSFPILKSKIGFKVNQYSSP